MGMSVRYIRAMKHLLPFAIVAGCCTGIPAVAQVSITSVDMPTAGDTVRFRNSTTQASMAETGPGHTWDFSALVPAAEGADTLVSVSATPILYQFFFNNGFLYPENKADFAMRGPAIGVPQVSISDVFNYYKSNAAGYRDVGFGANINGLPTSVQRTPVDWIYRFPMDFGNTDSSASHFQISLPTLGFYGQDQMRWNDVDGWGTLILPTDTFQVLRVRSRIHRTDTLFVNQFNFGISIPEPETIEYKWLAPGMKEPVLQVTTVSGANTLVRFYYHPSDISTGVAAAHKQTSMRVWPNPAGNVLHVVGAESGGLALYAPDGRMVRRIPGGTAVDRRIDIGDLAPGTYLLRTDGNGIVQKVVVAR